MDDRSIYDIYTKDELIDKIDKLRTENSELKGNLITLYSHKQGLLWICGIFTFIILKESELCFYPLAWSNSLKISMNIIGSILLAFLSYLVLYAICLLIGISTSTYINFEDQKAQYTKADFVPCIAGLLIYLFYSIF